PRVKRCRRRFASGTGAVKPAKITEQRLRQNVELRLPSCRNENRQVLKRIDAISGRIDHHSVESGMSCKVLSDLDAPVERGTLDERVSCKPDAIPRLKRRDNTIGYWRDGVLRLDLSHKQVPTLQCVVFQCWKCCPRRGAFVIALKRHAT